ncbi:extensin-like [Abrus precatorius]|uniref:Extensin-like n=1 Tax=Abrus precatorius TaxID=3816 RepID=A0A8B8L4K2_ABRPR|nr:extensin-like [Abrus precatorius]
MVSMSTRPLTEGEWKPNWMDNIFTEISVPLPPERSIIIHTPPSSPSSQEPPAKRLKTFVDKGKTIIDLDPEPSPCSSPAPAPAPLNIQAPPSDEAGPSTRHPSPPPLSTSRSPPPTIGWIDSDPDDLPPSPRPQPMNDSPDSDGMESDPTEDSFPPEFYL